MTLKEIVASYLMLAAVTYTIVFLVGYALCFSC